MGNNSTLSLAETVIGSAGESFKSSGLNSTSDRTETTNNLTASAVCGAKCRITTEPPWPLRVEGGHRSEAKGNVGLPIISGFILLSICIMSSAAPLHLYSINVCFLQSPSVANVINAIVIFENEVYTVSDFCFKIFSDDESCFKSARFYFLYKDHAKGGVLLILALM